MWCQLSLWHVTAEPGDVDGARVVGSADLQHLSGRLTQSLLRLGAAGREARCLLCGSPQGLPG